MAQQSQAAPAQAPRKPRASGESQDGYTSAQPSGQVENATPASRIGTPSHRKPIPPAVRSRSRSTSAHLVDQAL